jgi:hypothetical protein
MSGYGTKQTMILRRPLMTDAVDKGVVMPVEQ